jgi:hypothetical protein
LCSQVKTRDPPAWNGPKTAINAGQARAKKNPNERFGFNPPKEEVEETAEVAELLQRWDEL